LLKLQKLLAEKDIEWLPYNRTQHSVQPTSGILRVFWQFSEPRQDSVFEHCPRPAHLRLTQAVRRVPCKTK
jgi:hypothetical protein